MCCHHSIPRTPTRSPQRFLNLLNCPDSLANLQWSESAPARANSLMTLVVSEFCTPAKKRPTRPRWFGRLANVLSSCSTWLLLAVFGRQLAIWSKVWPRLTARGVNWKLSSRYRPSRPAVKISTPCSGRTDHSRQSGGSSPNTVLQLAQQYKRPLPPLKYDHYLFFEGENGELLEAALG